MREYSKDPSLFEEIRDGKVISICRYNKNRNRDGICSFYKKGDLSAITVFEDGIEKQVLYKFDGGRMVEYGEKEEIVYVGGYSGDIGRGFVRSGEGRTYSYENGKMTRVDFLKDGKTVGFVMKEFNESGELIYEGEYDGFVRNGNGIRYDSKEVFVYGQFKNGTLERKIGEGVCSNIIEMDDEGRIVYVGGYSIHEGRVIQSGKGKSFE